MVFGGVFLFLLAAYSQTGYLNKANQVGDVLAMGTSLLVAVTGLAFLLVTRGSQRAEGGAR
jgi:selenophosphate synthase